MYGNFSLTHVSGLISQNHLQEHFQLVTQLKQSHNTPMEAQGGRRCIDLATSALDGGEWSASRSGRALPPGKDHGYQWTEG
jgi:hypothetical protein